MTLDEAITIVEEHRDSLNSNPENNGVTEIVCSYSPVELLKALDMLISASNAYVCIAEKTHKIMGEKND